LLRRIGTPTLAVRTGDEQKRENLPTGRFSMRINKEKADVSPIDEIDDGAQERTRTFTPRGTRT
jgi:hypothetical protein